MSLTQTHLLRRHRRAVAGAAAAVALGGVLAGCGSSGTTAATTTTAVPAAATTGAPAAPQGTPPGLGTPATGAAADKATAAALAKYPGTAERVLKLTDGSYVVHVLRSSGGEVHVKVSKTFAVTGTEQGPPGTAPSTAAGTSPA